MSLPGFAGNLRRRVGTGKARRRLLGTPGPTYRELDIALRLGSGSAGLISLLLTKPMRDKPIRRMLPEMSSPATLSASSQAPCALHGETPSRKHLPLPRQNLKLQVISFLTPNTRTRTHPRPSSVGCISRQVRQSQQLKFCTKSF